MPNASPRPVVYTQCVRNMGAFYASRYRQTVQFRSITRCCVLAKNDETYDRHFTTSRLVHPEFERLYFLDMGNATWQNTTV